MKKTIIQRILYASILEYGIPLLLLRLLSFIVVPIAVLFKGQYNPNSFRTGLPMWAYLWDDNQSTDFDYISYSRIVKRLLFMYPCNNFKRRLSFYVAGESCNYKLMDRITCCKRNRFMIVEYNGLCNIDYYQLIFRTNVPDWIIKLVKLLRSFSLTSLPLITNKYCLTIKLGYDIRLSIKHYQRVGRICSLTIKPRI